MFQKKSFNLINEEDTKETKKLNCGWLRFLIVPSLMCFALLLILINVNFSGNTGGDDFTKTTPIDDLRSTIIIEKMHNVVSESSPVNRIAQPLSLTCQEINDNKCQLKCSVTSTDQKALNSKLQLQYQECKKPLDLVLQASTFKDNTFKKADLNGDFVLGNLTFYQCIFYTIQDNAFDKDSTKQLEKLIFSPARLEKITEKTFAGLEKIQYFEMINSPGNSKLAATAIVKPMAKTLNHLIFKHEAVLINFDPGDWLKGADLMELRKVDFQGNSFKDTLKKTSFITLKGVQLLSLKLCKIETLAEDTFDAIMETLQYLDLSQNYIKTLSPNFLEKLTGTNIELALTSNNWYCTCDNFEMLKAVVNGEIKFENEPRCFKPQDLYGEEIRTIQICCGENENECLNEPTTITTNEPTTILTTTILTTTISTTTISTTTISTTANTIYTTITTTGDTSTTKLPTTTESSIESLPTIELKCKRFSTDKNPLTYEVDGQFVNFEIRTITKTSVELSFIAIPGYARLLYFMNSTNFKYQNLYLPMIVYELNADESYVFCVMPLDIELVSPFRCRSHHMGQYMVPHFIDPWLKTSDVALFVTLTTVGAVVFLLIGFIAIYLLLRWRPTLLGKNKRLIKLGAESKQVFLKRSRSTLTTDEAYEALRTYAAAPHVDSNDYIKYFSSSSLPSTSIHAVSSIENLPPHVRAPALPPFQAQRPASLQSTIHADEICSLEAIPEHFNEHEYQSLEEYQQIYEINYARKEQ